MMKRLNLTSLDYIVALVVCGILAVVLYRYRTQDYFDVYGLLTLGLMLAGYLQYRRPPAKKEANQPPQRNAGSRPSLDDSPAPETPSSPVPRG